MFDARASVYNALELRLGFINARKVTVNCAIIA